MIKIPTIDIKKKKSIERLEEEMQIDFVKRIEPLFLSGKLRFTAIPNSTFTGWGQVNKNTAMGVRKGLPDMFFLTEKAAFFIEFKTPIGVLSDHQKAWIAGLNAVGIGAYVCRTVDEALLVVNSYFAS
jgi:hypothetical protein